MLSKANPLGKITEHVERKEFQVRGSPHAHCLLWVKDAPRVDVNTEEEVCEFVDKYICGKIPSETEENQELPESCNEVTNSQTLSMLLKTCEWEMLI